MTDHIRSKSPPPRDDDRRLIRTCNRCGRERFWVACFCECGCPEFELRHGNDEVQLELFR